MKNPLKLQQACLQVAWRHWLVRLTGLTPNELSDMQQPPPEIATHLRAAGFAAWPAYWAGQDRNASLEFYAALAQDESVAIDQKRQIAKEILTDLRQAGVRVIALKGLWSGHSLFPIPALRPFHDLDLLVRPQDKEIVERRLIRYGYFPDTWVPPRENFEWCFSAPELPLLELHFDLLPAWRIPWTGASEMLAYADEYSVPPELHARHALAHFAQHKGHVRPIQEVDLLLLDSIGLLANVPASLHPAQYLWQLRRKRFWNHDIPRDSNLRNTLLTFFYDARRAVPAPDTWRNRLRERLLGLLLSTRLLGWLRQFWRQITVGNRRRQGGCSKHSARHV